MTTQGIELENVLMVDEVFSTRLESYLAFPISLASRGLTGRV